MWRQRHRGFESLPLRFANRFLLIASLANGFPAGSLRLNFEFNVECCDRALAQELNGLIDRQQKVTCGTD